MMNDSISVPKRKWRISVRMLMAVPVVCSPILFWIAMAYRDTPGSRWERENLWTMRPLEEFSPRHGERVGLAEVDLVKVAQVIGPYRNHYYGMSRWLASDGIIRDVWHDDADAGQGEIPATAEFLAQLPGLLKRLPPSDPYVEPENRLYVAFPVRGFWEVRIYRKDEQPQSVKDLVAPLRARGL